MRVLHCVVGLAKTVPRDSVVSVSGNAVQAPVEGALGSPAVASICSLIRIFLSESTNWGTYSSMLEPGRVWGWDRVCGRDGTIMGQGHGTLLFNMNRKMITNEFVLRFVQNTTSCNFMATE